MCKQIRKQVIRKHRDYGATYTRFQMFIFTTSYRYGVHLNEEQGIHIVHACVSPFDGNNLQCMLSKQSTCYVHAQCTANARFFSASLLIKYEASIFGALCQQARLINITCCTFGCINQRTLQ